MNKEPNLSLQILLLNDLYNSKIIDKDLYDSAVKTINTDSLTKTQAA